MAQLWRSTCGVTCLSAKDGWGEDLAGLLFLPLLSEQPDLPFQFRFLLVQAGNQGCRFRFRRMQEGARLFHDTRLEAQALRDVERTRFSRQPA